PEEEFGPPLAGHQSTAEDAGTSEGAKRAWLKRERARHVGPGEGKSKKLAYDPQITLTRTARRAVKSEPVETTNPLSKLETGALGERIAIAFLQNRGFKDARPLNTSTNNYAVDMVADHEAIEVKTGLVSNGTTAQHWRSTIGQPGNKEMAWLKKASPE